MEDIYLDTASELQPTQFMQVGVEYATRDEFVLLKMKLQELTDQISSLSNNLGKVFSRDECSVIRVLDSPTVEYTIEEAKEKILSYYLDHTGEYIYPDEVADELGLDLKTAITAVNELLSEGSLEGFNGD